MEFETAAIRTQIYQTKEKEHSTPLFLTSSFTFDSAEEGAAIFNGEKDANLYSRFSNPNTTELIEKLALMEKCENGVVTASGMAAVFTTLFCNLKAGDHVVAAGEIFGNSRYIISQLLPEYGIEFTFVPVQNNAAWSASIKSNTKLLFVETPSNPTLKIADLEFLGKLCNKHELIYCVDNCFATPFLQRPKEYGADLIIHSATKYMDGQGRVLGGAILGSKKLIAKCYDFLRRTGASLSPFNAWILSKSLETLSLRMERHCENADRIADYLFDHSEIIELIYPHHPSFPQYELAKKQMSLGGGLVGCKIKGGKDRCVRFINALKLFSLTANLGDTRSIVTHPSSTTHSKLTQGDKMAVGITDNFVRFSIGLENIKDIMHDIDEALKISK